MASFVSTMHGCIVCELELCDGKKETAEKNLELEANNILRKMLGIEPKER